MFRKAVGHPPTESSPEASWSLSGLAGGKGQAGASVISPSLPWWGQDVPLTNSLLPVNSAQFNLCYHCHHYHHHHHLNYWVTDVTGYQAI